MVLVADSAVQLDYSVLKELNVEVCEYPFLVDGSEYPASMAMSGTEKEKIRSILKDKNKKVLTAGLKEKDLLEIYSRHKDEKIFSIHLSASASTATSQVIRKVISDNPELNISYYDSKHLVSAYSVIVYEAAKMIRDGASEEETDSFLNQAPENTRILGVLYDLFYLNRTGRIGKAKAIMGTAMKVIPVLSSSNPPGDLISFGKVKTPMQAVKKLSDTVASDWEKHPGTRLSAVISVVGEHNNEAEKLASAVKNLGENAEVLLCGTNFTNMAHVGPDYFDIGYTFIKI